MLLVFRSKNILFSRDQGEGSSEWLMIPCEWYLYVFERSGFPVNFRKIYKAVEGVRL